MFLFSISFVLLSRSILLISVTVWSWAFMSSDSFFAWVCTGVRIALVWFSSQCLISFVENWVASVNAFHCKGIIMESLIYQF